MSFMPTPPKRRHAKLTYKRHPGDVPKQLMLAVPPALWIALRLNESWYDQGVVDFLAEAVSRLRPEMLETANRCGTNVKPLEFVSKRFGYVYLMEYPEGFKVGRSVHPHIRKRDHERRMECEFKVIHTIECEDCVTAEVNAIRLFGGRGHQREWLQLTSAQVKKFKRLTPADLQETR